MLQSIGANCVTCAGERAADLFSAPMRTRSSEAPLGFRTSSSYRLVFEQTDQWWVKNEDHMSKCCLATLLRDLAAESFEGRKKETFATMTQINTKAGRCKS